MSDECLMKGKSGTLYFYEYQAGTRKFTLAGKAQLKARLEAKLADDPTLDIDVNREIETSDLTIKDLEVSIAIEMPSKWDDRFASKAELKRVTKATAELAESDNDEGNGGSNSGGSSNNGSQGGQQTGGGSDNNDNPDPEG